MTHNRSIWRMLTLAGACYSQAVYGQDQPPITLNVAVKQMTAYEQQLVDPPTPNPNLGKGFSTFVTIGDIASINGKPAKGTYAASAAFVWMNPNPVAGQALADITRHFIGDAAFEILQADGTPVGTIVLSGLFGGPLQSGSGVVVGGTGAFLGVRGQLGATVAIGSVRDATTNEDPRNRRNLGGGERDYTLQLIPMSRPAIVTDASGPVVVHASDFSRVTSAKPAQAGGVLTLIATGLGPTRPGVDPGQSFPSDSLQVVNSPVELTIAGLSAEVLYAGGYPGTTDTYQVNFRVPAGIKPGMASLQLTVAWVPGADVKIAVQ